MCRIFSRWTLADSTSHQLSVLSNWRDFQSVSTEPPADQGALARNPFTPVLHETDHCFQEINTKLFKVQSSTTKFQDCLGWRSIWELKQSGVIVYTHTHTHTHTLYTHYTHWYTQTKTSSISPPTWRDWSWPKMSVPGKTHVQSNTVHSEAEGQHCCQRRCINIISNDK